MEPKSNLPLDPLAARRAADVHDTPEGRESMREIARRVRAATEGPKLPVVDHWTKKKICHRFFNFVQTDVVNPLKPNEVGVQSNLVNVGCLGAGCSLWDDENKRCLDVSEKIATMEMAKSMDLLDGLLRMMEEGK